MEPPRRVALVPILRVVTGILLGVALLALGAWLPAQGRFLELVEWMRSLGPRGMLPFALAYAIGTAFLLPATPFPLAAGFLYGPWVGFVMSWAAETTGASIAYLLGRSVLRGRVAGLLQRWPVFAALDSALEEQGFVLLLLVRLSPVFPFGPLNYALSVSGVRPMAYLAASILGVAPLCFVWAWTGSALPHIEAVLAGDEEIGGSALFYWAGLVTTVLAVYAVTRATRTALARRMGATK